MTRQLKHRMNRQVDIYCPVCLNKPHTIGHILQVCPRSHGPRVQRHNKLCEFIKTKLIAKGYEVLWEPHIRGEGGLLKPDLLYWKKDSGMVRIIDVAVISDHVDPGVPYQDKVTKYNVDSVVGFARGVSGQPLVEVGALVINWRGAIARDTKVFLKEVIKSREWAVLSLRTLQYGVYSYDFWNKTTCSISPLEVTG